MPADKAEIGKGQNSSYHMLIRSTRTRRESGMKVAAEGFFSFSSLVFMSNEICKLYAHKTLIIIFKNNIIALSGLIWINTVT